MPSPTSLQQLRNRLLRAVGAAPLLAAAAACGGDATQPIECSIAPSPFCLDRSAMERMAQRGFGQVDQTPLRSNAEVAAGFDDNGCLRPDWVGSGCCNPALAAGTPRGDSCCYVSCETGCCGRPLVVAGEAILARPQLRSDWLEEAAKLNSPLATPFALTLPARMALAEAWRNDALLEHASIASFARFSLQLLALGAPAALVQGAQAAALDEVRHAQAAFSIASRLSEQACGPGALPELHREISTDLQQVLVATIFEGCVGETIAALLVDAQARAAQDSAIRAALQVIAADEARHAELAWRFVAWALDAGGPALKAAAAGAFERALAQAPQLAPTPDLPDDVLHHFGRLSELEQRTLHAQVVQEVLRPTVQALLVTPPAPGRS